MNKTSTFLITAAALGLIALVVKLPGPTSSPPKVTPQPQPQPVVVVPAPAPAPTPADVPGSLRLSGRLSHPYVTPGASDVFMNVEVTGVEVPGAQRSAVNVALVIDRSGSMSGEKLAQARRAAQALVDQLTDSDRLAIIDYGSDVDVMRGEFATPENKRRMKAHIARIQDSGGTNIADGLIAGRNQVLAAKSDFSANRIMLLSDGQPTVGMVSRAGLARLAQNIRAQGVTVTSLGIGYDFNEDLMSQLASVGGGSYGYLKDFSAIAGILQRDLQQATTLVARDVKLNLHLPDGVDSAEVLGRPSSVVGRDLVVTMPDFSAGQVERLVVRVRANASAGINAMDIGQFKLEYQDVLAARSADASLKLAAAVTLDSSLAMKNTDRDTLVAATRARSAQNVRRAAEMMERGQQREAQEELNQAQGFFDSIATVVGGSAVAEDKKQLSNQAVRVQAAPSMPAEGRSDAVKSMKLDSMRGSGFGMSAY